MVPISVYAANPSFIIKSPDSTVKQGESFTVTVELKDNPGFNALQFALSFDKTKMEPVSASMGNLVKGALGATNEKASSGVMLAAASAATINGDGNVLTASFKALKDISKYDFSLIDVVFADSSGNDLLYSQSTKTQGGQTQPQTPVDPKDPSQPSGQGGSGSTSQQGDIPAGVETQTSSIVFTDVSGHWGESFIYGASEKGLFGGYGNGKFGPDDKITRAQFITVLWRMAGRPEPTTNAPFKDIEDLSDEFKKAITWGYEKKIINGESAEIFNPGGYAKRQEIVKMLFFYDGAKSGLETLFSSTYDSAYSDSSQVASWAKPAMYWAIYNTLISGKTSTTLAPIDTATRAEVAKILLKYSDL